MYINLPDDCWSEIIAQLVTARDCFALGATCQKMHKIVQKSQKIIMIPEKFGFLRMDNNRFMKGQFMVVMNKFYNSQVETAMTLYFGGMLKIEELTYIVFGDNCAELAWNIKQQRIHPPEPDMNKIREYWARYIVPLLKCENCAIDYTLSDSLQITHPFGRTCQIRKKLIL